MNFQKSLDERLFHQRKLYEEKLNLLINENQYKFFRKTQQILKENEDVKFENNSLKTEINQLLNTPST